MNFIVEGSTDANLFRVVAVDDAIGIGVSGTPIAKLDVGGDVHASHFYFDEIADPATPTTEKWRLYFKTDGLYHKDDAGNVVGPLSTGGGGRELLTANRTYYVRTDGSNSNTGLVDSSGGAFLTIQKAVDVVATLDMGGYQIIIDIGDGTYNEDVTLKNVPGFASAGDIVIRGNNGTPANVVVNSTTACFSASGVSNCVWDIIDLKMVSGGYGILATIGSNVRFGNVNFGACTSGQVVCSSALVTCISNYSITGNSALHWYCDNQGTILVATFTITLTGTPAFSTGFVFCFNQGAIQCNAMTFTGSATGKRYTVSMNSTVYAGAGATYLPGNAAGSTATGGQYA
jgi:hypothetical protein